MFLNFLIVGCLLAMALALTNLVVVATMLIVGLLPWWAAGEHHPNRTLVTVLGLLGIFVNNLLLLWIVAMIWASVGKRAE